MSANGYSCSIGYRQYCDHFYFYYTQDSTLNCFPSGGNGCVWIHLHRRCPQWWIKWICEMVSQGYHVSKEVFASMELARQSGLWTHFNRMHLTLRGIWALTYFSLLQLFLIMRTIYRYEPMIMDNHAHRHIQCKPTPPFPLLAYSYFIISHLIWKWPEHSNRPFEVGCFRTQDEG